MSHTTASILDHAPGRIRFAVDAVAPAPAPLPTVPLGPRLAATLGGPLLATSHPDITPVVPDDAIPRFSAPAQLNPLVATVHHAFSQHRPLTLGPDSLWLTIAQGFAHHLSNHHEQLRDRLVRHDGKRPLTITRTPLRTAED